MKEKGPKLPSGTEVCDRVLQSSALELGSRCMIVEKKQKPNVIFKSIGKKSDRIGKKESFLTKLTILKSFKK